MYFELKQKHLAGHNRKSIGGSLEYQCRKTECGKRFLNIRQLKNHENIHDNNLRNCYFCPWAGALGEDVHISTHFDRHFLRPRFKCSDCEKTFYMKKDRNNHYENKHELVIGKYICKFCTYQTHSRILLVSHVKRKHK